MLKTIITLTTITNNKLIYPPHTVLILSNLSITTNSTMIVRHTLPITRTGLTQPIQLNTDLYSTTILGMTLMILIQHMGVRIQKCITCNLILILILGTTIFIKTETEIEIEMWVMNQISTQTTILIGIIIIILSMERICNKISSRIMIIKIVKVINIIIHMIETMDIIQIKVLMMIMIHIFIMSQIQIRVILIAQSYLHQVEIRLTKKLK
jgi:hypothetical protein